MRAEMMLRDPGWKPAAELIVTGLSGTIARKTAAYGLELVVDGATRLSGPASGQPAITGNQ